MSSRTSTLLFVIGIVLLVFGVLVYLTGWFFFYGMLIVALGAVLVLITSKPWLLKIAIAAIPVLLVAWSFSRSFGPAQTFLIPEGFSGRFIVVTGEPCGIPDNKVDGRYVVDVPADGITIPQREFQGGWVDDEYYFVDAAGRRTRITESTGFPRDSVPKPSVMLGGWGSMGGTLPDGSFSSEAPDAIHYRDYFVLTTDSISSVYKDQLDDLMESMVRSCRKRAQWSCVSDRSK